MGVLEGWEEEDGNGWVEDLPWRDFTHMHLYVYMNLVDIGDCTLFVDNAVASLSPHTDQH